MARPREFDETKALDAAMRSFWERGYEATSVRDLAASMGITSASLYNAFGDKRSLFRKALDHYVTSGFAARAARLEHDLPPRDAIVAFFEDIVDRSLSDTEHKGCLIVNSALELAPHDAECREAIDTVLCEMEHFFGRCVRAGQRQGTISRTHPPEDLARMLLGFLMGLRVLARSRPEPDLLRGALRPVLALLDSDGGDMQRKPARLTGNRQGSVQSE